MFKPAAPLQIPSELAQEFERKARQSELPLMTRQKYWTAVMAAEGYANCAIAKALVVSRRTVLRWREEIEKNQEGVLQNIETRGRKSKLLPETVKLVMDHTLNRPPPHGKTWSVRSLAQALSLPRMTIHRIWKAHGYPSLSQEVVPK